MTTSRPTPARRDLLRALAVLGGTGALSTPGAVAAAAVPRNDAAEPVVTNLGTAASVMTFGNGIRIGDEIWFATRQIAPTKVAAFDLTSGAVTKTAVIPGGAGVWGADAVGTDLYVSTYTPGLLFRIDTVTLDVTQVLDLHEQVGWTVKASPDGSLFVGTYPSARLWEYDPASGTAVDHGRMHPTETYLRDLVATETTVYCGIGSRAHLMAHDRASGTTEDLLPSALADRTFVATFAQVGDVLVAGMSPTAELLVLDLLDPSHHEIVKVPDNTFITAITGDGDDVWLGTRPTGTMFHYRLWSGTVEPVATPVPEASALRMGLLEDGRVWSVQNANGVLLDPADGSFTLMDLDSVDLEPLPEKPQSLATDGEAVFVGGTGGIQVHPDLATPGTPSRRVPLGGEPKDMLVVEGELVMGVYTLARYYSMPVDGIGELPTELGRVGPEFEQTRPHAIAHDRRHGLYLMGTEPDYGRWEGALSLYHVDSGEIETYRGIIPDQSIHAVQVAPHGAYLGGDIVNGYGTTPTEPAAALAYFDYHSRSVVWSLVPVPTGTRIFDLAVLGTLLVGTTAEGELFAVDVRTRQVLWTVKTGTRGGRVATIGARVYATDGDALVAVRVGRDEPRVEPLLTGLRQQWFGTPQVIATPDGALVTIRGTDLIRVDLP